MSGLRHVSLFSGVGGIDLAMHNAGIPTAAVCEIDKAARGVLAHRFPEAHIYHDVKEVTGDGLRQLGLRGATTVVSAGFPCQDLSVAGGRRGMGEGTRSGLYWEVDRILGEFAPAWVVLENVPGLLSAACACPGDGTCVDRGLAVRCAAETRPRWGVPGECIARHGGVMGAVLGSLAKRGYGFAYRVLDSRYFGVPQRRRRVVIVGRLGDDGRAPGQVLLEPEGVPGNPVAGIAPLQVFARRAGSGTALDDQQVGQLVIAPDVAATLTAGTSRPGVSAPGRRQEDDHNIVGFIAEHTTALDTAQGGPDGNAAQGGHLVAFQKVIRSGARDADGNLPPEVWAPRDVAATLNLNDLGSESRAVEVSDHLDRPRVIVRRLTPVECERLQGYPDNWTVESNGRPQADSPRYKQMGNSVTVPVFTWVARRLVAVHAADVTA